MLIIVSTSDNKRFCNTLVSFDAFAQKKHVLPNIYIVDTTLTPDQISTFDSVEVCAALKKVQVTFE